MLQRRANHKHTLCSLSRRQSIRLQHLQSSAHLHDCSVHTPHDLPPPRAQWLLPLRTLLFATLPRDRSRRARTTFPEHSLVNKQSLLTQTQIRTTPARKCRMRSMNENVGRAQETAGSCLHRHNADHQSKGNTQPHLFCHPHKHPEKSSNATRDPTTLITSRPPTTEIPTTPLAPWSTGPGQHTQTQRVAADALPSPPPHPPAALAPQQCPAPPPAWPAWC